MAVQKDYSVDGLSKAQIKELQHAIGTEADGLWGRKSQTALDAAYGKNADPYAVYTNSNRSGGSAKTHQSGYTGTVVKGKDGHSYTEYGALLREDGFFYPAGAKISPNGMYYDIGNGWQFAKHAVAFDGRGRVLGYVPGDMTGAAPGTIVKGFERTALRGSNAGGSHAETNEPDADEEESEEPSLWSSILTSCSTSTTKSGSRAMACKRRML